MKNLVMLVAALAVAVNSSSLFSDDRERSFFQPNQGGGVEVGTDLCQDCKDILGDIKTKITNPTTLTLVHDIIDKYICRLLPFGKETCTKYSMTALTVSWTLFAKLFDTDSACNYLNYCDISTMEFTRFPLTKQFLHLHIKSSRNAAAHEMCDQCISAFGSLTAEVTGHSAVERIENAITRYVCRFQIINKDRCSAISTQVIAAYLRFVSRLFEANMACHVLLYCRSPSGTDFIDMVANLRQKAAMNVNDKELCTECNTLVDDVKTGNTFSKISTRIVNILNAFVCDILSDNLKMVCSVVFETTVPDVYKIFISRLDSNKLCAKLRYC